SSSFVLIILFLSLLRSLLSTLFPYTTLFRSALMLVRNASTSARKVSASRRSASEALNTSLAEVPAWAEALETPVMLLDTSVVPRSEEHTSELQSHLNLVCRLLLVKKKPKVRK